MQIFISKPYNFRRSWLISMIRVPLKNLWWVEFNSWNKSWFFWVTLYEPLPLWSKFLVSIWMFFWLFKFKLIPSHWIGLRDKLPWNLIKLLNFWRFFCAKLFCSVFLYFINVFVEVSALLLPMLILILIRNSCFEKASSTILCVDIKYEWKTNNYHW